MDHAASALAGVASDMRAGEAKMVAQEFNEKRSRIDFHRDRLAVHGERYRTFVGRIHHLLQFLVSIGAR
jgi:hypothetical protein